MAAETKTGNVAGGNAAVNERTKKAGLTRSITAEKVSKLPAEMKYAHKKITSCRNSLDQLAKIIVDGGACSGELLAAIASVEEQVGRCMFAG